MPNQPRDDNPARQIRVDDNLWTAAKQAAANNRTTVSDIVRDALRRYVKESQR